VILFLLKNYLLYDSCTKFHACENDEKNINYYSIDFNFCIFSNKILSACSELSKLLKNQFELDSFEAGRCWGYISASTDIYKVIKYGSSRIVCIPEEQEVSDYVRIVIKYLNEHPKDLDRPAFELITKAFAEIFPCPQTQLQPQSPE
jgi:hypothetical protein